MHFSIQLRATPLAAEPTERRGHLRRDPPFQFGRTA